LSSYNGVGPHPTWANVKASGTYIEDSTKYWYVLDSDKSYETDTSACTASGCNWDIKDLSSYNGVGSHPTWANVKSGGAYINDSKTYWYVLDNDNSYVIDVSACNASSVPSISASLTPASSTPVDTVDPFTDPTIDCSGCYVDEVCYPYSYRMDETFCDIDTKSFISQYEDDSECLFNYSCSSYLCVDGKCVDEGVWAKVLAWFEGIFGEEKESATAVSHK